MQVLLKEDLGHIRVLTMNRPEKHNALDTELTVALIEELKCADADDHIRTIVLTGAGKSFCSGADTAELSGTLDDAHDMTRRAARTVSLHTVCRELNKPVISAVRGYALGGGAGIAIDSDMVVIAEDARFGYPELKRGIVGGVVMANLVRQLGQKKAFELFALSEPISGLEVHRLGLANRVAPSSQVIEVALSLAQVLASWDPLAMRMTKRSFHRACELPLTDALNAGGDMSMLMRAFRGAVVARSQN